MVLIAAKLELAKRMGKVIGGEKSYVLKVSDSVELRHKIHSYQPDIVLLDAQLGGSAWKALDEVPKILFTRSEPLVLLVAPWSSRKVESEAALLGCYDVLNAQKASFLRDVSEAVAAARRARRHHHPRALAVH